MVFGLNNFGSGVRFFQIKPDLGSKIIRAKNHPLTKTELTKKISQIGPAVPEEIGHNHTNILLLYIEDACRVEEEKINQLQ